MSERKVKLCFNATIDDDNGTMEMAIEWESSIEYAVAVLCTAAEKHPQIYEAIIVAGETLRNQAPKTDRERMRDLIKGTLESLDDSEVSDEDKERLLAKLMSMSITPQGNA